MVTLPQGLLKFCSVDLFHRYQAYARHFIFVHPAILQVSGCSGILLLSWLGNIIDWEEFKDYSSDCSHAKHFQFPWQTCLLLASIKHTATKEPTPRKIKMCPVCGIKPGTWKPGPSTAVIHTYLQEQPVRIFPTMWYNTRYQPALEIFFLKQQ